MNQDNEDALFLGIDLGPNSLGWALVEIKDGDPHQVVASGVRAFEAGLGKLEIDGKGVSRNVARREARLARRGVDRRGRRLTKIAILLQRAGLLPAGDMADPPTRHKILEDLDRQLFVKLGEPVGDPYKLRARALDEKLSELELGRALYHLTQRRGFLSNRKSAPKKDEKKGKVKPKISELEKEIEASGSRTLGEYFSRVDRLNERVRTKYTSRAMYKAEFELIWESQRRFHADILADDFRKKLYRAIFHQRPLKSQARFIGRCELEPKHRRAPMALLCAQRFRYLQSINNLRVIEAPGCAARELAPAERSALIEKLEYEEKLDFKKVRKLLKLPDTSQFNLEQGGEKKIFGNKTAAQFARILGVERWKGFSEEEQNGIVDDWLAIRDDKTAVKWGRRKFNLDDASAHDLGDLRLDDSYCHYSRKALAKLIPGLRDGSSLYDAIMEVEEYRERLLRPHAAFSFLPPVKIHFKHLGNPIVERALTELRHVVNAVIREYAKPEVVRIELARELKQSSVDRGKTHVKIRDNEVERQGAAMTILDETGITDPSRNDILKVLLYEECRHECPYTGKPISVTDLLGDHPQFDIEHIIPLHRSLDNSYMNKTLCHRDENHHKHDRTPYEAYFGTDKWDEIVLRVSRFTGKAAGAKLRRFQMTPDDVSGLLDDFTNRQLNDTAWVSRWAREYLGLLYGGQAGRGVDTEGRTRVQTTNGQVTAFLRDVWDLNKILGDGPGKSRVDHRHHAVDAIVVALTDAGVVKRLSDAASRATKERRRQFGKVPLPWETFDQDVRQSIDKLVVSHRLDRRVRGPLHKETFYSIQRKDSKGKEYVHVRKRIDDLKPSDLKSVVDKGVRVAIEKKLVELGTDDPGRAFKDLANHPVMEGKNRSKLPVHKVRLKDVQATFEVGSGHRVRRVVLGNNHHIEVVEVLDKKGNTTGWDAEVISLYTATQRLKAKKPVVNRDHGPGKCFLFSLACGDIIELDQADSPRGLFVVRTVPQSKQVRWVGISDARKLEDIPKTGQTGYPNTLRKLGCVKVTVDQLGRVRLARN